MKIAFIGQKGIPAKQGGVERHVQELSTRLVAAGFDVTVYSRPHYARANRRTYRGVHLVHLPSLNSKHLDAISHSLFATLHAIWHSYDIIHYHGVGPSLLAWLPRLLAPRSRVIVTFHTIDRQHQKWGRFARLMLAIGEWTACFFPHQTITVSQTLATYCRYRFDAETHYIPNGVTIEPSANTDILKRFGLRQGRYIVAVSRLVQHKGIHTLIKAYEQLETNAPLVIVGTGSNTAGYVEYLHGLAEGRDDIVFTGEQTGDDLTTLFRNAYVFVQPSETEGLSIALLEAMAHGVPIIISDIPENQEATNGDALEFQNRNIHDLANKLHFALTHPATIRKSATRAKRRAAEAYDWDEITRQTITLYETTLLATAQPKVKANA